MNGVLKVSVSSFGSLSGCGLSAPGVNHAFCHFLNTYFYRQSRQCKERARAHTISPSLVNNIQLSEQVHY